MPKVENRKKKKVVSSESAGYQSSPYQGEVDSGASGYNLGIDVRTASANDIVDYFKKAYDSGYTPQFTSGPIGRSQKVYWQAYVNARDQLGRDITGNEFADIKPYFEGKGGLSTGRQYLSTLAEEEAKSPFAMKKRAPEYAGTIDQMYQDLLARGATPAELEHLGTMMATGEIDPYEIQQFIQATPEYQTAQTERNVSKLGDVLKGYDTSYFKQMAPEIMSQYAKAGIQHSPALDYALTNLQSQIANKRGEYLAGLTYEGSQRAQNQQMSDYGNTMNQYLSDLNYQRQLRDMEKQALRDRSWNAIDYGIQQRDFMKALEASQPPAWQQWMNYGLGTANAVGNIVGALKP